MGERKLGWLGLVVVLYGTLLGPNEVAAGVEDIAVVQVIEEDVLVRGRTAYYTYRLQINNPDVPLTDVTGVVSSTDRSIRVTKRNLNFGDAATNILVSSTDTFTIRVSSRISPNLSLLNYVFSGEELIVNDDTTPPTISAQLSTQANQNGWHNAPVKVSFICADDVSIASCSDDVLIDSDGANQVIIGTAVDTSGNSSQAQVTINLDTQAPNIVANLAPSTDTPPSDNSSLLQKVRLNTLSEPSAEIAVSEVEQGQVTFLTDYASDANGQGQVANINLELGDNEFEITATDIADNQDELALTLERLQCQANISSKPFYIESFPLTNSDLSELDPTNAAFSGAYHQFRADAGDAILVVPGFINDDVLLDWVFVDGGEASVQVLINDGSSVFSAASLFTSGFMTPTTAILANLVDSEALDLAIGHSDGSVAIYAGLGDGSFASQATEVFFQASAIVEITLGDFNQDGFSDLLVLDDSNLNLYTRNDNSSIQSVITNGEFSNGLSGWMANATGHNASGQKSQEAGRVTRSANGAQLFENESFLVSLYQKFTPSADYSQLQFTLSSILLEQSEGAIPDVLEVSLLDANNQSLVDTVNASASSFLNIAADGSVNVANGVNYNNGQVSVDISGVQGEAILYFDLIGQPPGGGATYVVSAVDAGDTMIVDNSYLSSVINNGLSNAGGTVFCDAISSAPPILVANSNNTEVLIFQADNNGSFILTETLAQGGQ
ncbi:FG-GAP repeat domain-containing protein [Glaciecola petra]|uniref:VCBS repeat-containing protein n=1 Tax=Glaciecola petra TaxID=3075602 RepID=A0ABU2ZRR7_9ALTE|nr:VCBS repeat-containing protein [Aestuariibacter sp. P117]MDT0594941.1 VCBS repeat-containing protein [Aestuariibacter sp. P117]